MSLLSPASIAVIGASATEGKVGHDILQNLLNEGFAGSVYPVNPKGGEILGRKAYASVTDIPGDVDLAVIVIPAKGVPEVMRQCGVKGIRNVIVISAGFAETGTAEGRALEEQIRVAAEEHALTLIGPNCLGLLRPSAKLNASFARDLPAVGNVAFISQSGALAVGIMDRSPFGFSLVVSIGNKTVTDECDFLELCENDAETAVVGLYLENIRDGRRFLDVASRVAKKKPVVLLKSGVSDVGRRAAQSHTGALAGAEAAIDAACQRTGVRRARSAEEFLDLLQVLSTQPPLLSSRIAIVTNAGGPGILAADAAAAAGLILAPLTEENRATLVKRLPTAAAVGNPIDVLGDAGATEYGAGLEACGRDPDIDGVAVLLTPQVMTPTAAVAQMVVEWKKGYPLMPVTASFLGGRSVTEAETVLREGGVPVFGTPERAVRALGALRPLPEDRTGDRSKKLKPDVTRAGQARKLLEGRKGLLPEDLTQKILALYGLELPAQSVATSADEAARIADAIGYPVIAKVSSPDILHKTDVGGIRANLGSPESVQAAFTEIMKNVKEKAPNAALRGVLIQRFLPVGDEFIVGALRDASFGSLVMAGLGGIYTELFRDISTRLAPVGPEESYGMLRDLTAWKLLLGMRGRAQADIAALAGVVEKIGQLIAENEMVTDIDLNPVLVGADRVVIADAKIILSTPLQ